MNSKKPDTKQLNITKLPHQDSQELETLQADKLKNLPEETAVREKIMSSDASDPKTTVTSNLPTLQPSVDRNNFAVLAPGTLKLTANELAERLGVKPTLVGDVLSRRPHQFLRWSRKKDPEGIAWQRVDEKRGRSWLFTSAQ